MLKRRREKLESVAREGVAIYLVTGKETEAFRLNPSRVVTAARKRRLRTVLERTIKASKEEFKANCACPQCNTYAVHYLWAMREGWPILPKYVKRVCVTCGYTWKQLK